MPAINSAPGTPAAAPSAAPSVAEVADERKHDWQDCLDCEQDGCNIDEHPYNPTTYYAPVPDPAEALATYAEVASATVAAIGLADVVTLRSRETEVTLTCSGATLRDMGANADETEIALRNAGVPVKRFSVSSMYVAADPDIRDAVFLSPMPERVW